MHNNKDLYDEEFIQMDSKDTIKTVGMNLITQYSGEMVGWFINLYNIMPSTISFSNVSDFDDDDDSTEITSSERKKSIIDVQKCLDILNKNNYNYEILQESYIVDEESKEKRLENVKLHFKDLFCVLEIARTCSVDSSYFHVKPSLLTEDKGYAEKLQKLHLLIQEAKELNKRTKRMLYLLSKNGYITKLKFDFNEKIVIPEQFNDDFLGVNDKICEWVGDETKNGLIILHGLKGTGKTTYIKHLMNKFYKDKDFVYVTKDGMNSLTAQGLDRIIDNFQNKVVIFEDCEQVLKERTDANSDSFVSLLLNLTDGLLSDLCKCKFILTFNCPISQIDDALVRKGRCFAKYEFGKLCKEKSIYLLHKVGKEFDENDVPKDGMAINDIFFFDEKSHEKAKRKVGF